MSKEIKNNQVTLTGEIVSNFEFSHEAYGEKFCTTKLEIERTSSQKDIIPIMVSERLVDTSADWAGKFAISSGQLRSYNKHYGEKSHLVLSAFLTEIEEYGEILYEELPFSDFQNHVFLNGYICKKPVYRKTPLGREIADILLAVNRSYGKSDYIPCIAWGRNARFASGLEVGTKLQIEGRIQSREYQKRISDDETETRVAYEVSISKMETVEETEE